MKILSVLLMLILAFSGPSSAGNNSSGAMDDEVEKSPSSSKETSADEKDNSIEMLIAYFSQYAIAQLCNEVGNTFENDDIYKLKAAINEIIQSRKLEKNRDLMNAWSEISRQVNLNRHLLSQGDCAQASQWFSFALPNVKIGKSVDFPFK